LIVERLEIISFGARERKSGGFSMSNFMSKKRVCLGELDQRKQTPVSGVTIRLRKLAKYPGKVAKLESWILFFSLGFRSAI
jgi:hypothetical protein